MYTDKERRDDFEWFLKNYSSLFEKYGHKFFSIKNKELLGIYNSASDAINSTCEKYSLGDFSIQECNGSESGYTHYIFSPNYH